MKKVLLTLLAIIAVLGLFAASGYAGYRFGYGQGVQTTANGDAPQLRQFERSEPRGMPLRKFEFQRGFRRGFGPGGFAMMPFIFFSFFSPLRWLGRLAILALVIWFIYWLATRSGWRLTRQTIESNPPNPQDE